MLTQAEVWRLFDYNPKTGEFRWRHQFGRARAGERAGWATPHGYWMIGFGRRMHYAHRLAWLYVHGVWPGHLDHKNRDKLDNRIENLRPATHSQQHANAWLRSDNKLGVKGVKRHSNGYAVRITVARREIYVGWFKTLEEAAQAYRDAAVRHFGEFAYTGDQHEPSRNRAT